MKGEFTPLLTWFRRVKRPMPWRLDPTPYNCWLSEIMMQQTTYEQALPYYHRFQKAFPTVQRLAAADEDAVLKAWEGLGYYARARNLHKAAQQIVANGWPTSYAAWRELAGIGPYTAAALASVLNGERVCVVDGNVARVFARYWTLPDDFRKLSPREALSARLQPLICGKPGDFNQAMMELGALICTPKSPRCDVCPLKKTCRAHATQAQAEYPVLAARRPVPVRKAKAVVITDSAGRVLLVRHEKGGLLKGLWDLPTVESAGAHTQVFSHFKLELEVLRATETAAFADPRQVPLTTAARKVLAAQGRFK